jgi:hypothetical protein
MRQRGLRHVQQLGGLREGALVDDSHQIFELSQRSHELSLWYW